MWIATILSTGVWIAANYITVSNPDVEPPRLQLTQTADDRVHLPSAKLDCIFKCETIPSYYGALESVIGVYCLTDAKTDRQN
ncbi:hypothetical protein B5F33_06665 [Collinsella sp. An2]|nr:hypothetical protein B5F33_06665 [Collinsella sp. An2]